MACCCIAGQTVLQGPGSYSEEEADFLSELLVQQVRYQFRQVVSVRYDALSCDLPQRALQDHAANPVQLFMGDSAESSGMQAAMSDSSTT